MTAISLYPCVTGTAAVGSAASAPAFLRLEDRRLAAGQVVLALACYLAEFNDNIHGEADPAHAITARIRYGDLHRWQQIRTPEDVAAVLARAEQIAFDYFGRIFPVVDLVSRP
jgi:hypothetical protein